MTNSLEKSKLAHQNCTDYILDSTSFDDFCMTEYLNFLPKSM